jgi:hypothetical protein
VVTLQRVIQYLHPDAVPLVDYTILAHLGVEQITQWDAAALGPQPTQEYLDQVAASPEFLEWLAALSKASRKDRVGELIESTGELFVLMLAAHRENLELLQGIRTWCNQLRSQLIAAGLPLTVPQLPGKTWEQYKADVLNRAKAVIDAEP